MPYFPTYEEMLDALESARLKMWHEHGKSVDFGGPEFTLYVMEGLGKMEAPKILDEPQEVDAGDHAGTDGQDDVRPDDVQPAGKTTVVRTFGVEAATSEGAADEPTHEFVSNRNGKKCLECGEGPDADVHQIDVGEG